MNPRRLFLSAAVLLSACTPHTDAQAGSPDPDTRCTSNLCKPIGTIMVWCIDPTGKTPASQLSWDQMYQGTNITDGTSLVTDRLRCFCRSVGIESMLDNCYTCYIGTNQQNYWKGGIDKIKQRCGFATKGDASSPRSTEGIGLGRVGILGLLSALWWAV